jgi:hypothetical protein
MVNVKSIAQSISESSGKSEQTVAKNIKAEVFIIESVEQIIS